MNLLHLNVGIPEMFGNKTNNYTRRLRILNSGKGVTIAISSN